MRDLLETCPKDKKARFAKRAEDALAGKRANAIKIKCLECCNWDYPEAKRCQIRNCALWGLGGQDGRLPGAP